MDDNTFWNKFLQLLSVLIAVSVMTVGGCTAYETSLVAKAVMAGAEPIAARCGIVGTGGGSTNSMCAIAASRIKDAK